MTNKRKRKKKRTSDIAYQNKDIVSKSFAELFPKKSLQVYGLNTPEVDCLLPTNMPAIRLLFWLE